MALLDRRRAPFAVLSGVILFVCVAVLAIPESTVAYARHNRAFTPDQAGWVYRLLVFAAIAQAAYGGFVTLRPERAAARFRQRLRSKDDDALVSTLAREAVWIVVLTLVYGSAALAVTRERGGFWLFVLVAAAQALWYYRSVGETARWAAIATGDETPSSQGRPAWTPDDEYVPPVARGLLDAHRRPPRQT